VIFFKTSRIISSLERGNLFAMETLWDGSVDLQSCHMLYLSSSNAMQQEHSEVECHCYNFFIIIIIVYHRLVVHTDAIIGTRAL